MILAVAKAAPARKEIAMAVEIYLEEATDQCGYVPLAVPGYCLTRSGVLQQALWSGLELPMKC